MLQRVTKPENPENATRRKLFLLLLFFQSKLTDSNCEILLKLSKNLEIAKLGKLNRNLSRSEQYHERF